MYIKTLLWIKKLMTFKENCETGNKQEFCFVNLSLNSSSSFRLQTLWCYSTYNFQSGPIFIFQIGLKEEKPSHYGSMRQFSDSIRLLIDPYHIALTGDTSKKDVLLIIISPFQNRYAEVSDHAEMSILEYLHTWINISADSCSPDEVYDNNLGD